jgi:short-subunit dehydrogenase
MARTKTALITGGTSGIGFELAKLFAKDGYNLFIVARSAKELDETKSNLENEYKVNVHTIAHDLFDPKNAYAIYNDLKNKNVRIDVLVNNAGHGHYAEFVDSNLDMDLNIINLNISSLVILTKLFATDMVERGEGKILNLSSIAGKSPGPYQSVYHGTKAFVQSFTEALRYELKDKGITVTALLPGATDTDFFKKAGMMKSKIVQDPDNLADPADVAKDGYDALMADKDMVVSGLKNKLQVGLGHLSSDEANAKKMAKQQEPVDHKK